jgi:uncharacterized protein (DUF2252 family)
VEPVQLRSKVHERAEASSGLLTLLEMARTDAATIERAEHMEAGAALRADVPRRSHGDWEPAADRPDPVALLSAQDETRSADLVPIRHGRMGTSAFAFYRGAAAIMAADLASTPTSGLVTQICGDAHLSNLGVFATPERQLLFDLNDFDETLPGPWEWDLKRLAASFTIAARSNGLGKRDDSEAARVCAEVYRTAMADFARSSALDTWYARAHVDETLEQLRRTAPAKAVKRTEANVAKARTRTSAQAARKLTAVVDGRLRIVDDPPLVMALSTVVPADRVDELRAGISESYRQYRESLPAGPRHVLDDYEFVDIAHKVVGVGSVGLRAFIVLLQSRRTGEPMLLQLKEATSSVLEQHLEPSHYAEPGRRVVEGQRMMQAASDMFLGWSTSVIDGRHYYWRQLRDMKSSTEVERLSKKGLTVYARLCGWSLARAHARSGSPVAIAGYLGTSDRFDRAIAEFSRRYAAQNDADFAAHAQAIEDGSVPAIHGV